MYYDSVMESVTTAGLAISNCEAKGINPGTVCAGNLAASYGCWYMNTTDSNPASLRVAGERLLALYPKALTWTLAGGATTEVSIAYTVPGCNVPGASSSSMFVCSHITSQGSNFGVEYPFWVAQSWMYKRFIQYDLRTTTSAPAGVFKFTDMGNDGCSQFAA
jgi:hypothetical protein